MQSELCYNRDVPRNSAKKSEQIAMKLPPALFHLLARISEAEDRPLGYVARELMVRGIGLYRKDGRLRDWHENDVKLAIVKNEGELTDELQESPADEKATRRSRANKKTAK